MEQQITVGDKMLHGLLSLIVTALVVILAAIPLAALAHWAEIV